MEEIKVLKNFRVDPDLWQKATDNYGFGKGGPQRAELLRRDLMDWDKQQENRREKHKETKSREKEVLVSKRRVSKKLTYRHRLQKRRGKV